MALIQKVSRGLPLVLALGIAGAASAATQTFTPNPSNLDNLDHFKYYSWGIDYTKPANQVITSAVLTISNIYNWEKDDTNVLYTSLLNNPGSGFKTFSDNDAPGNAWAGQGTLLNTFHDSNGGAPHGQNLVIDLGALGMLDKVNQQAALGKLGFGFDPDCHFFNSGACLTIKTAPVPEPATMATLAVGAVALIRRRRAKKS